MQQKQLIWTVSIVALTVCLVSPGCSSREVTEQQPVVTVQTASVRRTSIQRKISAEGVLFPLHQATIVPKISAPVRKFYVNRGESVRAGQLLAVLENSDLAAALAESKGAYEQAQANYESTAASTLPEEIQRAELDVKGARKALDAAQQLYDSRKMLYKQGAMARKDLDQAAVGLTQAHNQLQNAEQHLQKLQSGGEKQQLRAARGQLASAKGKLEGAQAQMAYSEIHSPIHGVVTDRPLYRGEMATAGSPLMTVMDLSQVIARAHIPASEAELLRVGDAATLSVPGSSDTMPGKVTLVSPALDPGSTTVEVWVQASNPGNRFKPGTTVNLVIVAKNEPNALVIPITALLTDPDHNTFVSVVGPDGRAHRRQVQIGIQGGEEVQIVKGLLEGERVVTVGAYALPDNVRVKIEKNKD